MATSKATSTTAPKSSPKPGVSRDFNEALKEHQAKATSSPPETFESLCGDEFKHTVVEELDGVWHKEPGGFIIGTIQHTYRWEQDDESGEGGKVMYGVALRTTCDVMVKDGREVFPKKAGALIGVTVSAKLEELLYMRPGDKVAIKAVREVDIGQGRRVWEFYMKSDHEKRNTRMGESPALPVGTTAAPLPI